MRIYKINWNDFNYYSIAKDFISCINYFYENVFNADIDVPISSIELVSGDDSTLLTDVIESDATNPVDPIDPVDPVDPIDPPTEPPVEPPVAENLLPLSDEGTRKVIVCTDWWTDVDDAAALRLIAYMEATGKVDIVSTVISAVDYFSAPSISAFYKEDGISNMVIGACKYATDNSGAPSYQDRMMKYVDREYSTTISECEDAVSVLRRSLSSIQSSEKVDIIILGFANNVSDLLNSQPDDISSKTGLELINDSVGNIWIVGGKYPTSVGINPENNFSRTSWGRTAINNVTDNCPVPLTFIGFEGAYNILTGQTLTTALPGDILTEAFIDHTTDDTGNASWDPIMAMIACHGDPADYGYTSVYGSNYVDPLTGHNTFTPHISGKDRYVVRGSDMSAYQDDMNNILEKGWTATRTAEEIGKCRLHKLDRINSFIDDENMIANWDFTRFGEFPDGKQVYMNKDLSLSENNLITYDVENANVKYTKDGICCAKFTNDDKFISSNALEIGNEFTMYFKAMWETIPTENQCLLAQDDGEKIIHVKVAAGSLLQVVRFSPTTYTNNSVPIVPNQWHNITVRLRVDGATKYIESFFDGVLSSSVVYVGDLTANKLIAIGSRYADGTISEEFTGYMSSIRLYSNSHDDATITNVVNQM